MHTLSETAVYKGHKAGIWDLAFSPVEKLLASASGDRTIKLWNLTDGQCINTLCGHMQSVLRIQWIDKGMQMISAGADGLVKVWNLKKSESVATYNEHDEGKIWALAYSEPDKRLVTGGSDAKLVVWKDVTAEVEDEAFHKMQEQYYEEQNLQNLGHEGRGKDAAVLAFRLGKTREFVTIIENLLNGEDMIGHKKIDLVDAVLEDQKEFNAIFEQTKGAQLDGKQSGSSTLISEIVAAVSAISLSQLMDIIRDCNTNSHHALIAQTLLYHLVQDVDTDLLKEIGKKKVESKKRYKKRLEKSEGLSMAEVVDILTSYTERHATRVDKFIKFSCFIDYLAQKMNIVPEKAAN